MLNPEKFKVNNLVIWLAIAVTGLAVMQLQPRKTVVMTPAPDNKTEQAYRRNGFGDKIMTAERRKQFSACYKTMLHNNGYDEARPTPKPGANPESTPNFEGKITFVFQVDEDGSLLKYELADSDFRDSNFSDCISKSLSGIRFLPPPLGINRFLAHEFVFKSEDTFRREMEERKNQSPLTLVTATPGPVTEEGLTKK